MTIPEPIREAGSTARPAVQIEFPPPQLPAKVHDTRTYRPKRYSVKELSKAGIQVVTSNSPHFICAVCRTEWQAENRTDGRRPRLSWRCPHGCNGRGMRKNARPIPGQERYIEYRDGQRIQYVNKRWLQDQGWTRHMIQKVLGRPDKTVCMSYHRSPECLYALDRVEALTGAASQYLSPKAMAGRQRREGELLYRTVSGAESLLSKREREILRMLVIERWPERRIAEACGISRQMVSYIKSGLLREITELRVGLPNWLTRWQRKSMASRSKKMHI